MNVRNARCILRLYGCLRAPEELDLIESYINQECEKRPYWPYRRIGADLPADVRDTLKEAAQSIRRRVQNDLSARPVGPFRFSEEFKPGRDLRPGVAP